MRLFILLALVLSSAIVTAEEEAFVTSRLMTATTANKLAVAAETFCRNKGYQVTVAVVDRFGNLLAFLRNPLAGAHTIEVAQNKAYTAATLQSSTMEMSKRVPFLQTVDRISLVGGGLPIQVGGYMYGAIGVSGAPAKNKPGDVDEECAQIGIDVVKDTLEFAG